ncbi:MAG: hypothetical protein GY702_26280 [Desulfobulbaceae bacterium]|nr:hypothetical protein [Desulfobulbaceae bacterium]
MSGCGCGIENGAGPFSKGRELVEFVWNAHGGTVRDQPIRNGGLEAICQGCGEDFILQTYVGSCPHCNGVHAVAPMNPTSENIQFGGKGFTLAEV